MSWHVNQLKYAFGLGGLMSFYGVVGLIVWLLPPNMVGYQYKIVIIALVLLTLPFTKGNSLSSRAPPTSTS